MTPDARAALVKQRAMDLGFHAAGIADLSPTPHGDALTKWLETGMAGDMAYMHRQADRRRAPGTILPGATRAVVVTRHYDHAEPEARSHTGRVAKYARGEDYHEALRPGLEGLADFVRSLGDSSTLAKPYVDAGPVPERELAQRAGLGWIAKNTMLIDPHRGSYSFIAVVLTNLDLTVDRPFDADRCGSCRKCLDACPTGAIVADRVLDARRCISYLTIEFKGQPAGEVAAQVGDWIFGCDVCQDVCPWNERFASTLAGVSEPDPAMARLDLGSLVAIDDETFAARFGRTPLTRAGAAGIRRNARIAQTNADRQPTAP